MKKLTVLILLLAISLCSCTPKIDTSQFTEDNPYIVDNASIDNDMSTLPLFEEQYHNVKYSTFDDKVLYVTPDNKMSFRVKKESSKSYYWEKNSTVFFITISTVKVLEKLKGDNSDYYQTIKVNDTILVQEYYSFHPEGHFLSANKNFKKFDKYKLEPYNQAPYKMLKSNWYGFLMDHEDYDFPFPITYSKSHIETYIKPIMKFDTEYIINLSQSKFISSQDQKIYITSGDGKIYEEFPYEIVQNTFADPWITELSETAYNKALKTLEKYNNDIDSLYIYKGSNICSDYYDGLVISAWEHFGDKVGN